MADNDENQTNGSMSEAELHKIRPDGKTKWMTPNGVAIEYPVSGQYVLDEIERKHLNAYNIGSPQRANFRLLRDDVEAWWAAKSTQKAS